MSKNGRILYKAVIHVRSNYVIGYFETDIEAAIAYNKAVDCLNMQKIRRRYETNYIDTLSASAYADIYSGITLPDTILNFNQKANFNQKLKWSSSFLIERTASKK